MILRRALLLVPFLAASAFAQTAWKTSWTDTLTEAKKEKKCALLLFFNAGLKDCKRFESEALADPAVQTALGRYVCARIDPDGTDDDNKLWQDHKMPMPPMTLVFEPDGRLLAEVRTLTPKNYAEALENIAPAYAQRIVPARETLAKDPEQPDALVKLGEAYVLLDNADESARNFAKAADVLARKDKDRAISVLGDQMESFYSKKWYGPARECCKKLIELDPGNASNRVPKAEWILGMADCTDRKWNDAIVRLKAACDKHKDCDILHKMMFSLGSAYMYSGDKKSAIEIFEEIIQKFPDSESASLAQTQAEKLR